MTSLTQNLLEEDYVPFPATQEAIDSFNGNEDWLEP